MAQEKQGERGIGILRSDVGVKDIMRGLASLTGMASPRGTEATHVTSRRVTPDLKLSPAAYTSRAHSLPCVP